MTHRRYQIQNSHVAKQESLVLHRILVPAVEEHGFLPVHNASLLRENINRVRPEVRDELDDRVGTTNDTTVRTVVDGELEGAGR